MVFIDVDDNIIVYRIGSIWIGLENIIASFILKVFLMMKKAKIYLEGLNYFVQTNNNRLYSIGDNSKGHRE